MAFIDYSHPADPGLPGYVFHTYDGKSVHLVGDEADALKDHLDITRQPDLRMAQNEAAPVGADPSTQPQAAPVATDAGPAQLAPTAQQAIAAAVNAPVHVAGTPAVDPEKMAATGRYVPAAQTVTGLNLTPEQRMDLEEGQKVQQEQFDAASAQQVATAAKQTATFDEQARFYEQQAADAQRQRDEIARRDVALQAERQKVEAPLLKDQTAIAQMRVDPNRLFHGPSGAAHSIQSAIAVGLGAFGAALTGGPNYAAQIIDSAIQRDIDAQTTNIQNLRSGNATALAQIQQKYGVPHQEATKILTDLQYSYAESMAKKFAAKSGSGQAQQNALALVQDLAQKRLQNKAELYGLIDGRTTTQQQFVLPHRATAGFDRAPTESEKGQRLENIGRTEKVLGIEPGKTGPAIVHIGNKEVPVSNTKDASGYQSQADDITEYVNGLRAAKSIHEQFGASLSGDAKAKLEQINARNESLARKIYGLPSRGGNPDTLPNLAGSSMPNMVFPERWNTTKIDAAIEGAKEKAKELLNRAASGKAPEVATTQQSEGGE